MLNVKHKTRCAMAAYEVWTRALVSGKRKIYTLGKLHSELLNSLLYKRFAMLAARKGELRALNGERCLAISLSVRFRR